ncbi:MAG: hypothetical protein WKF70_12225 [Chitinophagaceae bacterium]
MNLSSSHVQACMEAWLNCENLLISLIQSNSSYSLRTTQVLDECANICLGTMHAIKGGHRNLTEIALLCVGICEECAEICERYQEMKFLTCAAICRECSSIFASVGFPAI